MTLQPDVARMSAIRCAVSSTRPDVGVDALGDRLQGARDQAAQTVGRLDVVVEADRANDRFEVMLGSA